MLVTLSGIVISVKFSQSPKASLPMLVTLSGIVILVIPKPSNAQSPILVIPLEIFTVFIFNFNPSEYQGLL